MRMDRRLAVAVIALCLAPLGCQGNSPTLDPQRVADARSQFVLAEEPAGVESVLDVQEAFAEPRSVVLVGQIGGVDNPWSKGQASFVLADPAMLAEVEDTGHVCTDAGCKFCVRKAAEKLKEGLAVVRFVDASGQIVPIDARRLFDVKEKQTVVVRGRAEMDGLGCLVVSADGLYIRR